jgi:hypothetical protein
MTQEEILEGNKIIFPYIRDNKIFKYPFGLTEDDFDDDDDGFCRCDTSWDLIHMVIDHINGLGKEFSFAIFKTYVSLTVEKGGKFYKDFSFAHAEYITSEQSGKEAAFKLIIKFIKWHNENNS